jgi:hypothetical protein
MFVFQIVEFVEAHSLSSKGCYQLIRPMLTGHALEHMVSADRMATNFASYFANLQTILRVKYSESEIRAEINRIKNTVPENLVQTLMKINSLNQKLNQGKSETDRARAALSSIRTDYFEIVLSYYPNAYSNIERREMEVRQAFELDLQIENRRAGEQGLLERAHVKWHPYTTLFDIIIDKTCMLTPTTPPGYKQPESSSKFGGREKSKFVVGEVDTGEVKKKEDNAKLLRQISQMQAQIDALNVSNTRTLARQSQETCLLCNLPSHKANDCYRYKMPARPNSEGPCRFCKGMHAEPCKQEYRGDKNQSQRFGGSRNNGFTKKQ